MNKIKQELEVALSYRLITPTNERINNLSEIIVRLYDMMANRHVTYKEGEAIISTMESLLGKVPIGRFKVHKE